MISLEGGYQYTVRAKVPVWITQRSLLEVTRQQIMQLLGHPDLRHMFTEQGIGRRRRDNESGSEEDEDGATPKSKRPKGKAGFEKVPSEEGAALMRSGKFGAHARSDGLMKRRKKLAYNTMIRELGRHPIRNQRRNSLFLAQDLIPCSNPDMIIHHNARCYSGQFSDDGNFFFSCAQDFHVRMYDTSNPYNWKYYKTVDYPHGQWTITDATLSPDNKYLAYSSIRNVVCLAPTDPEQDTPPTMLDFAYSNSRREQTWNRFNHFGIWSLRFSGDGREIVAGTSDDSVYVYDVESRQSVLRIPGHSDDVNAVCFGDKQSPHILYSGSDDTTIKVWDRRSLADGREAGVFIGHTEGLTYVDSKGDGRYVLSNAKDQTAKLWDLRQMTSADKAARIDHSRYTTEFEYRTDNFDFGSWRRHPYDCSLVTFRGHSVLRTLIRCHFSPPGSTDSRYVYSGSYDGSVYIWNLDATLKAKINVLDTTKGSRPKDSNVDYETYDYMGRDGGAWRACVRDASWHPYSPVIAGKQSSCRMRNQLTDYITATSWSGWGTSLGTCTVHTWNDDLEDGDEGDTPPKCRVGPRLDRNEDLYRATTASTRPRRRR